MIEVLVAALITMLAAAGAAIAFTGSLGDSGNLRARSQAQSLAEQSESRLRGMNIDQLSNLDQTRTVTINSPDTTVQGGSGRASGLKFSVHETAQFVSDTAGQASCANPSADYLETTSTVTWPSMRGAAPVTATGLLTPTIGSIDPSRGTLAVSVIDDHLAGVAGARVSITGPTTAAETTGTSGCVLFGDLPAGNNNYSVSITPPSGIWVDAQSGQTVSVTNPDVVHATVNAGSTASSSTQVQIAPADTAKFTFTNNFPPGISSVGTGAAAPAVILYNTSLNAPSYRLCAAADNAACPPVSAPDTSFPQETSSLTASPLFPYTYSAYAGVCSNDAPINGDVPKPAVVTAGPPVAVSLPLAPLVVRLYTGSSEVALPAGARLVVNDTGCNVKYVGYTGSVAPAPTTGQAVLPLKTAGWPGNGTTDSGMLLDPGLPDGSYSICYQSPTGKTYTTPSFQNYGTGETKPILTTSATTTGTC